MKDSDLLVQQIVEPFKRHALGSYPNECAAFVTDKFEYVPVENKSENPGDTVLVSIRDKMNFMEKHGPPLAFLHSHPDGMNCPSEADMKSQIANAMPYGIIVTNGTSVLPPFAWGDQLERYPLIGRSYRYGVHDCYSIARDYYFEKGIITPNVPRPWNWWKGGRNLFVDNLTIAKFHSVDRCDLMEGDALLFAINSSVPNHAGIYIGNGRMLHHSTSITQPQWDPRMLSLRDPVDRWMKFNTHCLRYGG